LTIIKIDFYTDIDIKFSIYICARKERWSK